MELRLLDELQAVLTRTGSTSAITVSRLDAAALLDFIDMHRRRIEDDAQRIDELHVENRHLLNKAIRDAERFDDLLVAVAKVADGMYRNDDEWFSLSETTKTRLVNLEKALTAVLEKEA